VTAEDAAVARTMPKASIRVTAIHDVPPAPDGRYVLYWMLSARRAHWNLALDRAVDWARALGRPLVVLEALRCDYQWASDRLHAFVIDGMRDNQAAFEALGVGYYPYVEPAPGAGRGLLESMAASAAVVVTDRAPVFDIPNLVAAAARVVRTRFEQVDGCGIMPLDAPPEGVVFPTAYAFRRYLQRTLPDHLSLRPRVRSLTRGDLPSPVPHPPALTARWPAADLERNLIAAAPIDHRVGAVGQAGGHTAARGRLRSFVETRLARYAEHRSQPDDEVASGLSPYLHFGHIAPHEVLARVLRHEEWRPDRLAATASGAKAGWWGLSASAEAFLDQLIAWRELGFNMSARRLDVMAFESLPAWALATLDRHATDPRPYLYTLDQFDAAETHDPLWNAAQRQLRTEGAIHNYLRMLWGKKILEWSASPREALAVMIALNNRYALDGRDPNSYSGIFWVLGRYDRPWPERPVFGHIRCMTSASTARKLRLTGYLARHGAPQMPQMPQTRA